MEAYKQIDKIVELSKKDVEFTENYRFNHLKTIERIYLYINNRFEEREDGIFWNISNYRSQHFAKNIELDTKDLMPYGEGDVAIKNTWILRKELMKWAKERRLAIDLNDLAQTCSDFGSAVWKVVNNDVELVDLRNLYFNPLAKTIREENIVEKHYLSSNEIRAKKEVWDNVEKVLKEKSKNGEYEINEFFGWYCKDEGEYNEETDGWKHIISYGSGDGEVILFEEEVEKEDNPYFDFHIGKYAGRWLRIGIVERLFDLQVRANQLVNQNAQSTEIASLLLFRSQSADTVGNVLEGAINGQIIPSGDLEQIGISNTGIQQFAQEMMLIEQQADKLCLTPDVIQGEALPSGTPFRSLATLTNAARSAFKMIRENIANTIEVILKDQVLPEVVKGLNREHILEISDEDDIEIFDQSVKEAFKREMILSGIPYTKDLDPLIDELVAKRIEEEGRKLALPKNFFNFKYGIKFNIAGEAYDKAQQNATMESALQYYMGNPAVTDIKLFRQYLENNGISYWKLSPAEKRAIQEANMAQGGQPQAQSMAPKQDKLMSQVDTN